MDDPLTHFDAAGAPRMVGVEDKPETLRVAVARARIRMSEPTLQRIAEGKVGKGDVLTTARLAAVMAAKSTSGLVPLCHPVRITNVEVSCRLDAQLPGVELEVTVRACDRTGPEMEAMTAAAIGALTIYDMCKAMDRAMQVEQVALVAKSGGRSGSWTRPGA